VSKVPWLAMAYQQRLLPNNPSRQHYEDRNATYAVPSPHNHGQRVSDPSERRFEHMRDYEYENGARGTRGHGEYHDRVQGNTWVNAPDRLDLDQPYSYRSAQSEARVTYDRRYDRKNGTERANRSNVETGSQGRGRGGGEGASPGLDTRPVKSQKNEATIRGQKQQKPRMSVWVPHFSLTQEREVFPTDRLTQELQSNSRLFLNQHLPCQQLGTTLFQLSQPVDQSKSRQKPRFSIIDQER